MEANSLLTTLTEEFKKLHSQFTAVLLIPPPSCPKVGHLTHGIRKRRPRRKTLILGKKSKNVTNYKQPRTQKMNFVKLFKILDSILKSRIPQRAVVSQRGHPSTTSNCPQNILPALAPPSVLCPRMESLVTPRTVLPMAIVSAKAESKDNHWNLTYSRNKIVLLNCPRLNSREHQPQRKRHILALFHAMSMRQIKESDVYKVDYLTNTFLGSRILLTLSGPDKVRFISLNRLRMLSKGIYLQRHFQNTAVPHSLVPALKSPLDPRFADKAVHDTYLIPSNGPSSATYTLCPTLKQDPFSIQQSTPEKVPLMTPSAPSHRPPPPPSPKSATCSNSSCGLRAGQSTEAFSFLIDEERELFTKFATLPAPMQWDIIGRLRHLARCLELKILRSEVPILVTLEPQRDLPSRSSSQPISSFLASTELGPTPASALQVNLPTTTREYLNTHTSPSWMDLRLLESAELAPPSKCLPMAPLPYLSAPISNVSRSAFLCEKIDCSDDFQMLTSPRNNATISPSP
ncbi:uncharacterized protein LOC133367828 [Rhineura floridana]|uniref:uncharacterized protein LOC133367828 n=1 Tax=Rhineura floridana TaxID=261503 RepID=UPI002AC80B84|nr:uncharacterized protein LOC133367828 [Rhineura floridana]